MRGGEGEGEGEESMDRREEGQRKVHMVRNGGSERRRNYVILHIYTEPAAPLRLSIASRVYLSL